VQVALERAGCVVRSKQVFEVTSLCLYACTRKGKETCTFESSWKRQQNRDADFL